MTYRTKHRTTLLKLSVFAAVSAAIAAYLAILVSDSSPDSMTSYTAVFEDVSGLQEGDEVRVASVAVGKVESMKIGARNTVRVGFDVPADIPLTLTTRATVRYKNLIGDRYLELAKPDGTSQPMGRSGPSRPAGRRPLSTWTLSSTDSSPSSPDWPPNRSTRSPPN